MPGTTIELAGETMRVERLLGSGGEGDVFELVSPTSGRRLALKWYHEGTATAERRSAVADLVRRGPPSERFLWPIGVVEDPGNGRFGYVMDVRPDGFVGLAALLRGEVARDESSVVRFAFELALAFRELHLHGLCYRDINFGNAFMHRATGAVLVCDNDNVGVEGVGRAQVLGSKKFMAPEIVRGQALPSKVTDRYSLAVLLFYLLVVHHPLEGRRTEAGLADVAADLLHYGYEPRFCFDPSDESNRPVPEWHAHAEPMWRALPGRVRDLFIRSFTDGLAQPERRVVDSEWCVALAEMRSGIFDCRSCGRSCYLEAGAPPPVCAHCGAPHGPVLTIVFEDSVLAVRAGAQMTRYHLDNVLDFDDVVGVVEPHPTTPGLVGLRNESADVFRYESDADGEHDVPRGRRAPLVAGAHLRVDGSSAVVRSVSPG